MQCIILEGCPFCVRVQMVVGYHDLYDKVEFVQRADYNLENPDADPVTQVPCLILDDGTRMLESMDICKYLDSTIETKPFKLHGVLMNLYRKLRSFSEEDIVNAILDEEVYSMLQQLESEFSQNCGKYMNDLSYDLQIWPWLKLAYKTDLQDFLCLRNSIIALSKRTHIPL